MRYHDPSFDCPARFPTTAWSLIANVKDQEQAGHVLAVNELTTRYWRPIFCFIRARGYSLDRAEDLAQEFFLRFLQRDWIRRVDPGRGRFRTFMLTVLTRFLADQGQKRITRQKHFEKGIVSISMLLTKDDRNYDPPAGESPETLFMRRWSLALVDHVRGSVRRELIGEGREAWYDLFEASVIPGDGKRTSQPALARRFGLSRDQVRYRLDSVRRRFDRSFRVELRCEGCSEKAFEEEVQALMDIL